MFNTDKHASSTLLCEALQKILEEDMVVSSSKGSGISEVCKGCLEHASVLNTFLTSLQTSIEQCCSSTGHVKVSSVWKKFHVYDRPGT